MNELTRHVRTEDLPPMQVTVQGDVHVHVHSGVDDRPVTQLEQNILEALGEGVLATDALAKKAGYRPDSHFRNALAELRRRGLILNLRPGYRRANPA